MAAANTFGSAAIPMIKAITKPREKPKFKKALSLDMSLSYLLTGSSIPELNLLLYMMLSFTITLTSPSSSPSLKVP